MDASLSKRVKSVETGGHTIPMGPSGATVYDPVLGEELKRKYKGSADVKIAEKSYMGLKEDGIHSYTFAGVDMSNIKSTKKMGKWVRTGEGRMRLVLASPKSERNESNGMDKTRQTKRSAF